MIFFFYCCCFHVKLLICKRETDLLDKNIVRENFNWHIVPNNCTCV